MGMTPTRRLPLIALLALVLVGIAAPLPVALAQEGLADAPGAPSFQLQQNETDDETPETMEFTVFAQDSGADASEEGDYWFTTDQEGAEDLENPPLFIPAGANVTIHFVNEGEQFHNLHIGDPIDGRAGGPDGGFACEAGCEDTIVFTMPEDAPGSLDYWCDPHLPLGMDGTVYTTQSAYDTALQEAKDAQGGDGGEDGAPVHIEELGVNYLAYWVGVIAFAALLIVYGSTFFLFKYGESFTTTDHKDRSGGPEGAEAARGRRLGIAAFVTVVAVVAVLAAWRLGFIL